MFFSGRRNCGISEELFLKSYYKAYINFASVKIALGQTPSNATSISPNKQLAMKKCYSEYLERYAMGLAIDKRKRIRSFDYISSTCTIEKECNFSYGDSLLGHSDTTGTAAGIYSKNIIKKGICELVEKNDLLCFWYGKKGYEISDDTIELNSSMRSFGFLADVIRIYVVEEISNYPTIILFGFKNTKLITTGVCCAKTVLEAMHGAICEAKIIEWQQYDNQMSTFENMSLEYLDAMQSNIERPQISFREAQQYDSKEQEIAFSHWINSVRCKMIFADARYNLKVVKIISDELMISVPTLDNIRKSNNKEIVKRYFLHKEIDCPVL